MAYKTDIEIAQECQMKHIREIAAAAHVDEKYIEQYGNYKAKIDLSLLEESNRPDGKLILVTAITPTPAGEGKTTTTIGLADGRYMYTYHAPRIKSANLTAAKSIGDYAFA